MIVRCYTDGLPLSLNLSLKSSAPIQVTGFDDQVANTVYFDQRVTPEWIEEMKGKINFPMPISPDSYLMVKIRNADASSGNDFKLFEISNEKLKTKALYLTPEDGEFIRCAEWFCQECGTLQPNFYRRGAIEFQLFDVIIDEKEGPLTTPARVDHETGVVQVAKRYFDKYSIPMRMFIMTHERVHYIKNTVDEKETDLNAMNIDLSLGYPKIELLYAATKVFPDNAETRERINAMIEFAKNWTY